MERKVSPKSPNHHFRDVQTLFWVRMKFQFLPENFSRSENAPPFETRKIRHFEVERIFLKNKKMLHHFWSSKPLRTSKLQIRAVFSYLRDACSGALLLRSEVFGSIWRNCVDLNYSIVRMSIRGNNRNSFFARCRLKNQVPDFLWFLRDCRKPVFFYKSLFSLLILFCDML